MAHSLPALVEPAVLRWARESIGLSAVAAARKIKLPVDRIEQWESGAAVPTIAQLRVASRVYRRPLGVFFLPAPPADFDAMRDFRRHDDGVGGGEWSPELHGEYRRGLIQREYALELAELDDAPPSTAWRLTGLPDDDEGIAAAGRTALLARAPTALPRPAGTKYDHLNFWTAALEESGILVLATRGGDVLPSEMRAFSIYFDLLPVIMVNGSDAPRGRLFSLLHEYAHLLLHTSGLCDTITDTRARTPDRLVEARCNAIAAAVLMPRSAVLASPDVLRQRSSGDEWDYEALRAAAAPFGVSAEALLRRLATLGLVPRTLYQARRDEFLIAYADEEARAKTPQGNWYRNTARNLGKAYVRRIADAHRRRVIDSYTAASFLDVKVDQITRLAEAAAVAVHA